MVDSIKRGPKEVDPKGKDPDVVDSVRGGPIQVDSIGKGPSPGSWFKRGTCVPNLTTVLKMCKKMTCEWSKTGLVCARRPG